jgi:hypothetical protein
MNTKPTPTPRTAGFTPGAVKAAQFLMDDACSVMFHIHTMTQPETPEAVRAAIADIARIIDRETAAPQMYNRETELIARIVTCESCNGTGKQPGNEDDACFECGGVGENLDGDAIFVAIAARDTRAALALADGKES